MDRARYSIRWSSRTHEDTHAAQKVCDAGPGPGRDWAHGLRGLRLLEGTPRGCLCLNHLPATHPGTWLCSSSARQRASSRTSFWKTADKCKYRPSSTTPATPPSTTRTEKSGECGRRVPSALLRGEQGAEGSVRPPDSDRQAGVGRGALCSPKLPGGWAGQPGVGPQAGAPSAGLRGFGKWPVPMSGQQHGPSARAVAPKGREIMAGFQGDASLLITTDGELPPRPPRAA